MLHLYACVHGIHADTTTKTKSTVILVAEHKET